jgi:hypothetical protein
MKRKLAIAATGTAACKAVTVVLYFGLVIFAINENQHTVLLIISYLLLHLQMFRMMKLDEAIKADLIHRYMMKTMSDLEDREMEKLLATDPDAAADLVINQLLAVYQPPPGTFDKILQRCDSEIIECPDPGLEDDADLRMAAEVTEDTIAKTRTKQSGRSFMCWLVLVCAGLGLVYALITWLH